MIKIVQYANCEWVKPDIKINDNNHYASIDERENNGKKIQL